MRPPQPKANDHLLLFPCLRLAGGSREGGATRERKAQNKKNKKNKVAAFTGYADE